MFLLALWGIAICGTMASGRSPLKGWISGWIGLLIVVRRPRRIHGVSALHVRQLLLEDGISYVPVLIGLFGLAEILRVLPQKSRRRFPRRRPRRAAAAQLWQVLASALRSG